MVRSSGCGDRPISTCILSSLHSFAVATASIRCHVTSKIIDTVRQLTVRYGWCRPSSKGSALNPYYYKYNAIKQTCAVWPPCLVTKQHSSARRLSQSPAVLRDRSACGVESDPRCLCTTVCTLVVAVACIGGQFGAEQFPKRVINSQRLWRSMLPHPCLHIRHRPHNSKSPRRRPSFVSYNILILRKGSGLEGSGHNDEKFNYSRTQRLARPAARQRPFSA